MKEFWGPKCGPRYHYSSSYAQFFSKIPPYSTGTILSDCYTFQRFGSRSELATNLSSFQRHRQLWGSNYPKCGRLSIIDYLGCYCWRCLCLSFVCHDFLVFWQRLQLFRFDLYSRARLKFHRLPPLACSDSTNRACSKSILYLPLLFIFNYKISLIYWEKFAKLYSRF